MKNPGIAAVLSFLICGLGQIYNGQILKGLILVVCYGISWGLTFVLVGWIFVPILWIYGIYDAYKNAEKINKTSTISYI
jgi:TM2 domain-containing membrane protein YozV